LYFAWSRPAEIGAELGVLENRFPTLFEFRRALWPALEALKDPAKFPQSVEGFLDHIVLHDFEQFRQVVRETTGNDVPVMQRQGDKPPTGELGDRFLKDIDTLVVVSLDHQRTSQSASQGEIDVIRHFLSREERCVVVCPHHDIGVVEQLPAQEVEFRHHGDPMIPAQQRFSGFARSLLEGLGFAIENQFGLRPGALPDGSPAPFLAFRDLDKLGLLQDVTTFNVHPHLPHLFVPPEISSKVDELVKQPINLTASPHPFTQEGNRYFNALLQCRGDQQAGSLFVCDATLWSSAFQGLQSLRAFWRNLSSMKI
jgi:hypothetical protein